MRNKFLKIVLPAMLALFAWSCSEESNMDPEGQWSLSSPTVISPAEGASIVLNEATPSAKVDFTWTGASSSDEYGVYYSVVIDSIDSENFDTPILEVKASNSGKALTASIAYNLLDEALSLAGYPANAVANVKWAVKASCLSRATYDVAEIAIKRFEHEIIPGSLYISGEATEAGSNLANAIQMTRIKGAGGVLTNKYEVYTSLTADKSYKFYSAKSLPAHTYGGTQTEIVKTGQPIVASTTGVYRITVDLGANSCQMLKIDRMGVIGEIFASGWGSDKELTYQGGGVWKGTLEVVAKKDFIFRLNDGWADIFKQAKGSTTTNVFLESQAAVEGIAVENIPYNKIGMKVFTISLKAGNYTYSVERDPNSPASIETPAKLFLLANGTAIQEFTKVDDTFTSPVYLALQSSVTYTLNSAADGSGTSYAIDANIGATATLGGDKVSALVNVTEEAGDIKVEYDQAYALSVDFAATKLSWSYFNIKLFHWGNWDTRDELVMTYVHPYKFTLLGANLVAGYNTKFISPWEVQFGVVEGSDNATAISGTTTNNKTSGDFKCISTSGSYDVLLTIDNLYKKGTYSFTAH